MQRTRHRRIGILAAAAAFACAAIAAAAAPRTEPKPARPGSEGEAATPWRSPAAKADEPQSPRTRPAPRSERDRRSRILRRRRTRSPQPYSKNHTTARKAFEPIAARANSSTVAIYCNAKQVALGAVVDAAGYILTKASELTSAPECRFRDGRKVPAAVVGKDERNDVALLKASAKGLTPIQWAADDNPPVGSWIVTPGLADVPVSIGVVSVAMRKLPAVRRPSHGFLGVMFASQPDAARIRQILPKTGAARAGLKADDVITRINGKPVKDRTALQRVLRQTKPDQEITLRVRRGEKELDLSAALGKYPAGGWINPQQYAGGDLSERRTGFERIIQHDSTLQPNQCGGPALDADGKAVGINISRAGRVESYILPASLVRPLIAKLKAAGDAKPKKQTRRPAPSGTPPA